MRLLLLLPFLSLAGVEGRAFGSKEGEVRSLDFQCPKAFPHLEHYHGQRRASLWCFASSSPKKGRGPSCNPVTNLPPPSGQRWGSNPDAPSCAAGGESAASADRPLEDLDFASKAVYLRSLELKRSGGGQRPKAKRTGETCSKGEPMDPSLLIWGHWDIVVKAVYASFFLRHKAVPRNVERAYLKLIEVWSRFKEGCFGEGSAHFKCKDKVNAADFTNAFHKNINSIAEHGFDASKALVFAARHTNRPGFAQNGAHRTGIAIATGDAICVTWRGRHAAMKRSMDSEHYRQRGWDLAYFLDLGYPSKFVDETMEHWLAIDKLAIVVALSPRAVAQDGAKWAGARKILEQCSVDDSILVHKDVAVNAAAMQHILLTVNGGEAWTRTASLLRKKAEASLAGLTNPVARFVVIRGGQARVGDCLERLSSHYGLQEPSTGFKGGGCHIGSSLAEHAALGRQVFNRNTLTYWRRAAPSPVMAKLAQTVRAALNPGVEVPLRSEGHWTFPDSFIVETRGGPAMKSRVVLREPGGLAWQGTDQDGKLLPEPPGWREQQTGAVAVYALEAKKLFKSSGAQKAHHRDLWWDAGNPKSLDNPIDIVYGPSNYAWGDGFKFTPSYVYG
jgi:hypothetical protein